MLDSLEPSRRAALEPALAGAFGDLDGAALAAVASRMQWVSLPGGATLFRRGDAGRDVYVVVNGRLRATAEDPDGGTRVLEEVGRGAAIGEIALLTGETRAATVVAVRDCDLVRLPREAFDALVDSHPRAMMHVARAAALRLRGSPLRPSRGVAAATFALVPATPGASVDALARRLRAALGGERAVACIGCAEAESGLGRPGIAQADDGDAAHDALVAWLSAQEREYRHVLLVADGGWTPWTRRCLRQADRVLVVANAADDPSPGEVEAAMRAAGVPGELVLVHDDVRGRPASTGRWLAHRDGVAHHHVRVADDRDIGRLARRVSGTALGLVLGGGGARGFAHIGMLRALSEDGIDVDLVGGTSIGALIAGAHAHGVGADDMVELARVFASRRKLLDRTIPFAALMSAGKVTRFYQHLFGEARIEDLWTPLFAVSSSLSRARAVVHRHGAVWKAVRASTAIPAIFPPMLADDGEVLVDGNVMNNMPLDVMREWCGNGTVIGLNPMPTEDKMRRYNFGPTLTGWEALLGRLKWFGSTTRAPSILGSVMRATEINSANRMRLAPFRGLADLLVEPKLGSFPILAFDQYASIIDIGYRAAREALDGWRRQEASHPAAAD